MLFYSLYSNNYLLQLIRLPTYSLIRLLLIRSTQINTLIAYRRCYKKHIINLIRYRKTHLKKMVRNIVKKLNSQPFAGLQNIYYLVVYINLVFLLLLSTVTTYNLYLLLNKPIYKVPFYILNGLIQEGLYRGYYSPFPHYFALY